MFLFRNFLNVFFYSFSCFLSWDLLFVSFLFRQLNSVYY